MDKGKTAIAVPSIDKLPSVIDRMLQSALANLISSWLRPGKSRRRATRRDENVRLGGPPWLGSSSLPIPHRVINHATNSDGKNTFIAVSWLIALAGIHASVSNSQLQFGHD
jgi:hypothetical protein